MRGQPAPELGAWHHLLGTVGVRSSSGSADVVVEFVVQVEQGQTQDLREMAMEKETDEDQPAAVRKSSISTLVAWPSDHNGTIALGLIARQGVHKPSADQIGATC
jgi:hypothetical protein